MGFVLGSGVWEAANELPKEVCFQQSWGQPPGGGFVLTLADIYSEPGAKQSHSFPLCDQRGIRKEERGKEHCSGHKDPHPLKASYTSLFGIYHVEDFFGQSSWFYQRPSCFKDKAANDEVFERGLSFAVWASSLKKASWVAVRFHAKFKWNVRVSYEIIVKRWENN